jgi:hypothetical protein
VIVLTVLVVRLSTSTVSPNNGVIAAKRRHRVTDRFLRKAELFIIICLTVVLTLGGRREDHF